MPRELAQLLVEEGVVGAADVERAMARQRQAGGALDSALLELELVPEERLVTLLSRASDLPAAPLSAYQAVDARARRVFPSKVAERHGLAPFALDGRELSLVATSPIDLGLLDEISFMLSLHLTPHVGPEWRIRSLIQRLYGGQLTPRLARLAEAAARGPGPGARAAPSPAVPPGGTPPGSPPAGGQRPAAEPRPAARPPQRPPGFQLFSRDADEPAEPLAAALAQAAEAYEVDWRDEAAGPGGGSPPSAPGVVGPATAAAPEAPPPPVDRSAPPRWTLEKARAVLAQAESRDEVVLAALRYARDFFQCAALFAVTRDAVAGHDALGLEEGMRDICRTVAIYAADPGIFRTALDTRAPYLGPVARDVPGSLAVLDGLGRGAPRTALVYAILLRERPVCILYADNGAAPASARRLGDLLLFLSTVGGAFERIIRARKATPEAMTFEPVSLEQAPAAPGTWSTAAALASEAPPPGVEPDPPAAVEPAAGAIPVAEVPSAETSEGMRIEMEAEASAETSPVDAPSEEATSAAEAPAEQPSAEAPATGEPPAEEPFVEQPSVEAPSAVEASAEQPSAREPLDETRSAETAFADSPFLGAPSAASPSLMSQPVEPSAALAEGSEADPTTVEPAHATRWPPAEPPTPELEGPEVRAAPDRLAPPPAAAEPVELTALPDEAATSLGPESELAPEVPVPAEPPPPEPTQATDEPSLEITLEKPLTRRSPFATPEDPAALVGAYLASLPASEERAFLLTRLSEHAEQVAPILCEQLPGPLAVDPTSPTQPPAAEQGPVYAAVAALGPAAVKPLLVMLSDRDPARRRAAVTLLGQAGEAAVFGPLADRCFDADATVAEAARRALARHRRDPALKPVAEKLRRAVLSGLGGKASAAARAIGAMRDAEAVPLLIQALEGSDAAIAGASAEALAAITLQRHGPVAREWLLWWKRNRGRTRADWLFGALTSGDRDLRVQAATELSAAASSPVAYSADLPDAERLEAARSWAAWFERGGHRV